MEYGLRPFRTIGYASCILDSVQRPTTYSLPHLLHLYSTVLTSHLLRNNRSIVCVVIVVFAQHPLCHISIAAVAVLDELTLRARLPEERG